MRYVLIGYGLWCVDVALIDLMVLIVLTSHKIRNTCKSRKVRKVHVHGT